MALRDNADIESLVQIWEQWTDNDSVLRRAVHGTVSDASEQPELWQAVYTHMMVLLNSGQPFGGPAGIAVFAAEVVYRAFRGHDDVVEWRWRNGEVLTEFWYESLRSAQQQHLRVLAAMQEQGALRPLPADGQAPE